MKVLFKASDFVKSTYRLSEVAELLGVTIHTLHNYDNRGYMQFERTSGNQRIMRRESLLQYLDSKGMLYNDLVNEKHDIIYARVSSNEQKIKGDLDRQVTSIIEYHTDLKNPIILKEVGSGLNDNRKKLLQLIDMVMDDKVNRVFVTYRDRLTRFGFNYLNTMFTKKGVKIVIMNNERDENPQLAFTEDVMALMASFSGKLYGSRSHKNKDVKK